MPGKLSMAWTLRVGCHAGRFIARQRAFIKKRDEVPAHREEFLDVGRKTGMDDGASDLVYRNGGDPVGDGLIETDDAAGNVPSAVVFVFAPSEQMFAGLVPNEQVDIYHRNYLQREIEGRRGQSVARISQVNESLREQPRQVEIVGPGDLDSLPVVK